MSFAKLYSASSRADLASLEKAFGLPLIEAAQKKAASDYSRHSGKFKEIAWNMPVQASGEAPSDIAEGGRRLVSPVRANAHPVPKISTG